MSFRLLAAWLCLGVSSPPLSRVVAYGVANGVSRGSGRLSCNPHLRHGIRKECRGKQTNTALAMDSSACNTMKSAVNRDTHYESRLCESSILERYFSVSDGHYDRS